MRSIESTRISLGAQVLDKVSGMRGIVVGRGEYLYNTPMCWVAPQECSHDGKPCDRVWIDEKQLAVVRKCEKHYGF